MKILLGMCRGPLLGGVLVLSTLNCTWAQEGTSASDPSVAYSAAVADAEVAEPSEISDKLTPVLPSETETQWNISAGEKHVLTVTWTSWDGYDAHLGLFMTLSQEVWITLVPQVAEFCSLLHLDPEHLDLRLEQLLGLPPRNKKTKFVEMWVRPDDLFRPCPDAETYDNRCGLDFPAGTDPEHKKWFNERRNESYGKNPYPWIRG